MRNWTPILVTYIHYKMRPKSPCWDQIYFCTAVRAHFISSSTFSFQRCFLLKIFHFIGGLNVISLTFRSQKLCFYLHGRFGSNCIYPRSVLGCLLCSEHKLWQALADFAVYIVVGLPTYSTKVTIANFLWEQSFVASVLDALWRQYNFFGKAHSQKLIQCQLAFISRNRL